MKLFSILLVLLFSPPTLANYPFCNACSVFFKLPKTWEEAQPEMMEACRNLLPDIAVYTCQRIVENSDLTESFPCLVPHMQQIRDYGCKHFC